MRGIDISLSRRISGLGCTITTCLGCEGPGCKITGFLGSDFFWKNGLAKLVEGWSDSFESVFCLMVLRSEIEK